MILSLNYWNMDIQKKLKQNNKSLTQERLEIFDFMKQKHIFTCNDLLDWFQDIGRASVFRNLKMFLEIWAIRRVNLGERIETYEVEDDCSHHEHMKCQDCGDIINFDSIDICNQIALKARELGFEMKEHHVTILGSCKNCC